MYLRTTQREHADGSVVRYVQLAHNHRKDGVTQAEVLVNLGREDRLDADGLRRLVALIAARADTAKIVSSRMRKGSAGSSRGVVRFVDELAAIVRRAGATGAVTMRADSGF